MNKWIFGVIGIVLGIFGTILVMSYTSSAAASYTVPPGWTALNTPSYVPGIWFTCHGHDGLYGMETGQGSTPGAISVVGDDTLCK